MGDWHKIGHTSDLKDGENACITIHDRPIAIFRVADQYYAIDDTCPHMAASLSTGDVTDLVVECPWHYWRFSIVDGTWVDNKRGPKLRSYPIRIVGDEIELEYPDPPSPAGRGDSTIELI